MSKLAEIIQQHERETARRYALERTNRQITEKFESEKQSLAKRHSAELQRCRTEWEEERNTLLAVIQEECNSLFESKRSSFARQPSPRSDASHELLPGQGLVVDTSRNNDNGEGEEVEASNQQRRIDSTRSTSTAPVISPTFSDMDSVLRETEQLIEGLF